jgi:hypothetical protein
MENLQMELHMTPGLFPEVATALGGFINAGGDYFEGDKTHSVAGMSKNIIKKIVPKLFKQTTNNNFTFY